MDEVKNKKYLLAKKAMMLWRVLAFLFFFITFQVYFRSEFYNCSVLVIGCVIIASDAFFKMFVAKYAQDDQKTYRKKDIKDTLLGGIISLIIILCFIFYWAVTGELL